MSDLARDWQRADEGDRACGWLVQKIVVNRLSLSVTMAIAVGSVFPTAVMGQDRPVATQSAVVSADHVSDGLRRPELVIPMVTFQEPTFRSGVTERLETPLDVIRRELREEARLHPWENAHYTPGVIGQVDVLPALVSLVTKIRRIRYEHAEAEARQMVHDELAAFCAQHNCSQAAELPIDEGIIVPRN